MKLLSKKSPLATCHAHREGLVASESGSAKASAPAAAHGPGSRPGEPPQCPRWQTVVNGRSDSAPLPPRWCRGWIRLNFRVNPGPEFTVAGQVERLGGLEAAAWRPQAEPGVLQSPPELECPGGHRRPAARSVSATVQVTQAVTQ
jgi:hypothetical protein